MNFETNKESFLKTLTKIQGIIEKKHTIPILSNVLLELKSDQLIVTATDLEIGLRSFLKVKTYSEGKITVSAKKLYEIIREMPNKTINFTAKNNFWIEITCEKSVFNLVGLSSDEFPNFPEINENSLNEIDNEDFNKMIDKTIFSVSNDESKYNLNGIFLKNEEKLVMVATDGHRLSYCCNEKFKNMTIFNQGIILPKKGIYEFKKIVNKEQSLFIGMNENNFTIKNDNAILIMRIVDGEFPDYNKVLPKKCDNYSTINKLDFLHALKRISILSSEKLRGVKFNLEKNKLIITSSNPDYGDAKEEIDIKYSGEEISIGFNSKYILDILNSIEDEFINFHLKDNLSPGMIEPVDDSNFLSVIMPMRL